MFCHIEEYDQEKLQTAGHTLPWSQQQTKHHKTNKNCKHQQEHKLLVKVVYSIVGYFCFKQLNFLKLQGTDIEI